MLISCFAFLLLPSAFFTRTLETIPPDVTVSTLGTTTTDGPTLENAGIYCDNFPDPSIVDEGNYGDMTCYMEGDDAEELLFRKTLINFGGTPFYQYTNRFPGIKVTRVSSLNFGRYHGFTTAIGIFHEKYESAVEMYIDMQSGKEFRIFLEVYGYPIA